MPTQTSTFKSKSLLKQIGEYLPEEKSVQVEEALKYAFECHKGQKRDSGAPYIEHPLNTALLLADMRLDATTLCAALLHDVIEDCEVSIDELTTRFGPDVSKLVDGVTKLTRMEINEGNTPSILTFEDRLNVETLRKMLVAMAEDIRVVLIKLADRLHNMFTLNFLSPERQKAIAQETLDIYAPLAHRLGIWDIKWQLEDLSFRYLKPLEYRQISKMISIKRIQREHVVGELTQVLLDELVKMGVKSEVIGRVKHIYSIYQKGKKYSELGKTINDIYDLYAIRVLVNTNSDCYQALGVIHNLWRPIPGQFDDYIANPKENLYQSLHTTVMCKGTIALEVQIRTHDMHHLAEYGVASHWRYKEGFANDVRFEEKMTWLRQLLEWPRDIVGTDEFLESVKTDIFRDQVFVYSPKGDVKELPAGATPLDFAYRIHTELGHRCVGAKVNGRLISLDYQLKNGDSIEIMTTKIAKGPSLDWLNSNLGYIHTTSARNHVRQWFRKQRRGTNIQTGRDLIRKESKRLNMRIDERDMATLFKVDSGEEFLLAIGSGAITINQVINKLTAEEPKVIYNRPIQTRLISPIPGISVLGVDDILTRIGKCCNPLPGNEIIGFITRTKGITIHKNICHSVQTEDEPERFIEVQWNQKQQLYPVSIEIHGHDRVGLLSDITAKLSAEGVNIATVSTKENTDGGATISLTIHISGLKQLSRLFTKLETIRGVTNTNRITIRVKE
ncbi:bifunctional (p)ppGpp synthetase/guanosine-3',5'-bis(diphosphate) 3'-pyrophosphohydrolase [SAR202 cluster bacterium AC-409-J13_OGT_754m]|nr:bifunctional (p)ppGpp synthetase/guanosine-3',5'-bis(diphosphate) 3'-pyrophosphohydrolase [SAR202 cluster bacterium AC-409-J13_OGT_754m]